MIIQNTSAHPTTYLASPLDDTHIAAITKHLRRDGYPADFITTFAAYLAAPTAAALSHVNSLLRRAYSWKLTPITTVPTTNSYLANLVSSAISPDLTNLHPYTAFYLALTLAPDQPHPAIQRNAPATNAPLTALDQLLLPIAQSTNTIPAYLAYLADPHNSVSATIAALIAAGVAPTDIPALIIQTARLVDHHDQPTALGRHLLSLLPAQLSLIRAALTRWPLALLPLLKLLLAAPRPQPTLARSIYRDATPPIEIANQCAALLHNADPASFAAWAQPLITDGAIHVAVRHGLLDVLGKRHPALAATIATTLLTTTAPQSGARVDSAISALRHRALAIVSAHDPHRSIPLLEAEILTPNGYFVNVWDAMTLLEQMPPIIASPALKRCILEGNAYLRRRAFDALLANPWPERQAYALSLLTAAPTSVIKRASAWLLANDPTIVPDVAPLLDAPEPATRLTAINILRASATAQAHQLLTTRYAIEPTAAIRSALLDAIALYETRHSSPTDQRIAQFIAHLTADAATLHPVTIRAMSEWLPDATPTALLPRWRTGAPLTLSILRYLLHRQSGALTATPCAVLRWVTSLLDPTTTPDLAHTLYHLWRSRGERLKETWILGVIGPWGDDRLVPIFRDAIITWGAPKQSADLVTKANRHAQALVFVHGDAARAEVAYLTDPQRHIQGRRRPRKSLTRSVLATQQRSDA